MGDLSTTEQAAAIKDLVWGQVQGFKGERHRMLKISAEEINLIRSTVKEAGSIDNLKAHLDDLQTKNPNQLDVITKAIAKVVTDLSENNGDYRNDFLKDKRLEQLKTISASAVTGGAAPISGAGNGSTGTGNAATGNGSNTGTGTGSTGSGNGSTGTGHGPLARTELTPEQKKALTDAGLDPDHISSLLDNRKFADVRENILSAITEATTSLKSINTSNPKAAKEQVAVYDKMIGDLFKYLNNIDKEEANKVKTDSKARLEAMREKKAEFRSEADAVKIVHKELEGEASRTYGEKIKEADRLTREIEANKSHQERDVDQLTRQLGTVETQIEKLREQERRVWRGKNGFEDVRLSRDLKNKIRNFESERDLIIKITNHSDTETPAISDDEMRRLSPNTLVILRNYSQDFAKAKELQDRQTQLSSEPKDMPEAIMKVAVAHCAEKNIDTTGKSLQQLEWELYNKGLYNKTE